MPCILGQVTIDVLPDDALLNIFDRYKDDVSYRTSFTWRWITMTHVCQRWRDIIFGSPRHLDLRVVCTNTTPTRTLLGIWPLFPISVYCGQTLSVVDEKCPSNIIAAFEHSDRISEVFIMDIDCSELENLAAVMQRPFPILSYFHLRSFDESIPVIPETFLGGSTPRLRTFFLSGIPFLSFPKFVFSATRIEDLTLLDIPNSGYISLEVMATCSAALPNLKRLYVGFRSPLSRPTQMSPPPLTRSVLPALTYLYFHGVSEYLEDFLTRIETPLLGELRVVPFMDLIFHIPQLHDFICRTEGLMVPWNQAYMKFTRPMVQIILGSPTRFGVEVRCERPDWQLSSMTQIFSQQLPLLSHIEHLEIREGVCLEYTMWKDDSDMDSSLWLELLHLFISVHSLYVSNLLGPPIATALEEVGKGRTMEVLPALRNLFLEGLQPAGPVKKAMQLFVTLRRLSGHPIVIQNWER